MFVTFFKYRGYICPSPVTWKPSWRSLPGISPGPLALLGSILQTSSYTLFSVPLPQSTILYYQTCTMLAKCCHLEQSRLRCFTCEDISCLWKLEEELGTSRSEVSLLIFFSHLQKADFNQFRDILAAIPWNCCLGECWWGLADKCIPIMTLRPKKLMNWLSAETLHDSEQKACFKVSQTITERQNI